MIMAAQLRAHIVYVASVALVPLISQSECDEGDASTEHVEYSAD